MKDMAGYLRNELPVFYDLEMQDWKSGRSAGSGAAYQRFFATGYLLGTGVADGHLGGPKCGRQPDAVDAELEEMKKSPYAFLVGAQMWTAMSLWRGRQFAEGKNDDAVATMRKAAEQQDKLGQGEVDIPAREMLGDMLMELNRPEEALVEYKVALVLSPNRLNGLYGAGRAAEALGKKKEASSYYEAMLKNTDDGAHSSRTSLAHAKAFVAGKVSAAE